MVPRIMDKISISLKVAYAVYLQSVLQATIFLISFILMNCVTLHCLSVRNFYILNIVFCDSSTNILMEYISGMIEIIYAETD